MEELTVTMEDSGNRLFVGNLPFHMSRDEVFDLFAQAGSVVSVHLPTDRETGRPRGFGFVEMEDAGVMEQAIQMFNGYSVDGRALVVNQARPREGRPSF
jgi:RNA recognition motif-containing protein